MRSVVLYAALFSVGAAVGALCQLPAETSEPPLAGPFRPRPKPKPDLPPLPASDLAIFDRLKDRIDRRVEERMAEAIQEAADEPDVAKAGPLAVALVALVTKVVKATVSHALEAVVFAAVVAMLWRYWWVPVGLLAVVMFVSGVTARLSSAKKE